MSGYYVSTFFMFNKFRFMPKWEVITIKELLINEKIMVNECRLVGVNNEQLGIMSIHQARSIAEENGLDIALISPSANPPVCKIMDYGKFKFDQTKKQKEAKKKQKTLEMKVIQLSLNIGEHDVDYRTKQAREFFEDGAKVKISLMLKGRQQAYSSRGIEVCKNFYNKIADCCVVEKDAFLEGKFITMILGPKSLKDKEKNSRNKD